MRLVCLTARLTFAPIALPSASLILSVSSWASPAAFFSAAVDLHAGERLVRALALGAAVAAPY